MESGEIIYEKVYASPWSPPTISFKDNWIKELDSEVAGSSKDSQRIQPKPKTQLSSTERPVCGEKEEIEERTKFDRDTLNQEKHDEVTDPYVDTNPQNVAFWHLNMLKMIRQVRGDPYWWIKMRSTKLTSEYQDCHTQLWKKPKISEFKSSSKRSKIIHSVYSIRRETSRRIYLARGETDETAGNIQARPFMARTEGKAKMGNWKTKTR